MQRQIKLIWDFKGSVALETAKHHEIHLKEFISIHKIVSEITGFESISEMHAIAFMVVNEQDMIVIRDTLKPHRGEVYNG
jgi:hypothetical protein